MSVFALLVAREARLLCRRPAELANPLVFFAIVIALFPLAVGPETKLLQTLSPGLVWVAALLSVLLSLDGLFRSDFEDGSLEQWVLSSHPLPLLVLAARSLGLNVTIYMDGFLATALAGADQPADRAYPYVLSPGCGGDRALVFQ